jgi:hypothetical protein
LPRPQFAFVCLGLLSPSIDKDFAVHVDDLIRPRIASLLVDTGRIELLDSIAYFAGRVATQPKMRDERAAMLSDVGAAGVLEGDVSHELDPQACHA